MNQKLTISKQILSALLTAPKLESLPFSRTSTTALLKMLLNINTFMGPPSTYLKDTAEAKN